MKYLMIVMLLFFFISGCVTTRVTDKTETEIKFDTLSIVPPVISKTLPAFPIVEDSVPVIQAEEIIGKDTIILVKYYPVENRIYVKAKPDTIIIPKIDTVRVQKTEIKQEPSFWDKNFWYIIFVLAAVIVIIILIKK